MTRKPLGRGLDALIGGNAAAPVNGYAPEVDAGTNGAGHHRSPAFMMIDSDRIVASPFQPRRVFESNALEELAATIRNQGVVEPLIVRLRADGAYELIAGERRLRASRLAGLERLPAIVRELDDRGALEISLVENLVRENLNAIEEARAFSRLNREFAMTHDEIGARIGKSRAYVSNTIRLLELPLPVLEMIDQGELTAGQVRPLLTLGSADDQIDEARRIVEGQLTARDVEKLASERRKSAAGSNSPPLQNRDQDPNLAALAQSIQRALKRKVQIKRQHGRRSGRIELEYYNDDDLTGLALALTGGQR
jgi:ParB family transcriptional regulator, chromosome partitioning protein